MDDAAYPELAEAWPRIQSELRRMVGDSTYQIWLEGLTPTGIEGNRILVGAPQRIRSWVATRFDRVLQISAASVLGPDVEVTVVGKDDPATSQGVQRGGHPAAMPDHGLAAPPVAPNPKYSFDQFVIGESNRLAHAAALAVAELPAQAYNPLFIYGPPGVGKTHLLHAVANYIEAYGAGLTVRYTTIESFTNHFIHAVHAGSADRFKALYRRNDVLLIDDVQFLESKVKTEEEFFHTFNALYDTGSQLVLTSDRMPRDLHGLADRLRERFESGLVCDIDPADFATRLAILRKRVAHDGVEIADEAALHVIAERITANVRALEGALIRVVAFHSLTRRPIDATLAHEVLEGLYPGARPVRRSIPEIQRATCEAFDVTLEDLLSSSRVARLVWARQVAMYLSRELTDATLPAIGSQFGGRNHATVLHAYRRATARMGEDPEAYAAVHALSERLHAGGDDRRS